MENAIGFRCWSDRFACVILSGTQTNPVVVFCEHRTAPKSSSRPESLAWLRSEIHELLDAYIVNAGAYRCSENNALKKDLERGQFEGVLIEACFSHRQKLKIAGKAKITMKSDFDLETKKNADADFNKFLGHESLDSIPRTSCGEACLVALSCLKRD